MIAAEVIIHDGPTAFEWCAVFAAGAATLRLTQLLATATADLWHTLMDSIWDTRTNHATHPDTILTTTLHGAAISPGDWVTLHGGRQGEFRGVTADGRVRVHRWSDTLGRIAKGRAYYDPAHVHLWTAGVDAALPGLTAGRLVRFRTEHSVEAL